MAAFDFPSSPTDGQTYSLNGMTFKYSSARTAWEPYSAPLFIGPPVVFEYVCTGSETSVIVPFPAGFRDIELQIDGRGTTAAATIDILCRINGDTGANYDMQLGQFSNTSPSAFAQVGATAAYIGDLPAASATAGLGGQLNAVFGNYGRTTFHKTCVGLDFAPSGTSTSTLTGKPIFNKWRSTAAIASATVFPSAGAFAAGTVITATGKGGGGAAQIPGPPTYYATVSSGSYTFLNSPSPSSGNTILSVTIPASSVARVFACEAHYATNSSGGNNSGLQLALDATTYLAGARNIPTLDGNYSFGFMSAPCAVLATIPGDNAAHTIKFYGGQYGGGGGFTVTTAYAALIARQIA